MAVAAACALVGAVLLVQRLVDARGDAPVVKTVAATRGAVQLPVSGLDPSACYAFPPTAGDRGKTVFLDAGHGGADPGTEGSGIQEKEATLAVEVALAGLLRADGYRVVVSRTADTAVTRITDADLDGGALRGSALHRDLVARIDCANAAKADTLLAIHFNGFDDPTAGGSETFYDAERPFAARNQKLAEAVQAAVVKELRLDDRGATSDDDLDASTVTDAGAAYGHLVELGPAMPGWVERPSTMPGALAEPLFLTAPDEGRLAASTAGRAKIAKALYDGLVGYLGG